MHKVVLALALASLAASLPAQSVIPPAQRPVASATEIMPPPGVVMQSRPNSVILRPGTHSEIVKALTVKRQFEVNQLRANPNPVIMLGQTTVHLAPLFNNPSALPNVATRLRAMPQLAEVFNDHMQVLEVSQGLILHHFLSYRLKPGTCSDPARRSALSSSGVRCAAKLTDEMRAAAFATKGNARYVADPRQRAIAIADATKKSAAMGRHVAANLVKLRASLNNPAERAKIDSLRGAGEAARLSALTDDQLKAEVINSGVTKIEQTMFVPTADKLYEIKTGQAYLTGLSVKPPLVELASIVKKPAAASTPDAASPDRPLQPQIFLTGFTLGRDYEWSQQIEKTVSWCFVGCDETYYVEAHAGFDYGLGLRFPIQLDGTYHYSNGKANVKTNFTPKDGSRADYIAAGLNPGNDQSKYPIFDGKELVAEFDAHAGASYSLPSIVLSLGIPPTFSIDIPLGKDFTDDLAGDFAHGQFTPPAPCPHPPCPPSLTFNKTFDDFDLIGGQANFGILGAQVFPAVQVGLHSDSLQFTLTDHVLNKDTTLTSSGQTTDLGLDKDNTARFTIGYPLYNLGLDVTPGIDAHEFIDIEVWSDSWDQFIWLPQLAIHLPPGGVTFHVHDGTTPTRDYEYPATGSGSSSAGAAVCKEPGTAACFDSDSRQMG